LVILQLQNRFYAERNSVYPEHRRVEDLKSDPNRYFSTKSLNLCSLQSFH